MTVFQALFVGASVGAFFKTIFSLLGWYSQVGPDAVYRAELISIWDRLQEESLGEITRGWTRRFVERTEEFAERSLLRNWKLVIWVVLLNFCAFIMALFIANLELGMFHEPRAIFAAAAIEAGVSSILSLLLLQINWYLLYDTAHGSLMRVLERIFISTIIGSASLYWVAFGCVVAYNAVEPLREPPSGWYSMSEHVREGRERALIRSLGNTEGDSKVRERPHKEQTLRENSRISAIYESFVQEHMPLWKFERRGWRDYMRRDLGAFSLLWLVAIFPCIVFWVLGAVLIGMHYTPKGVKTFIENFVYLLVTDDKMPVLSRLGDIVGTISGGLAAVFQLVSHLRTAQ